MSILNDFHHSVTLRWGRGTRNELRDGKGWTLYFRRLLDWAPASPVEEAELRESIPLHFTMIRTSQCYLLQRRNGAAFPRLPRRRVLCHQFQCCLPLSLSTHRHPLSIPLQAPAPHPPWTFRALLPSTLIPLHHRDLPHRSSSCSPWRSPIFRGRQSKRKAPCYPLSRRHQDAETRHASNRDGLASRCSILPGTALLVPCHHTLTDSGLPHASL